MGEREDYSGIIQFYYYYSEAKEDFFTSSIRSMLCMDASLIMANRLPVALLLSIEASRAR